MEYKTKQFGSVNCQFLLQHPFGKEVQTALRGIDSMPFIPVACSVFYVRFYGYDGWFAGENNAIFFVIKLGCFAAATTFYRVNKQSIFGTFYQKTGSNPIFLRGDRIARVEASNAYAIRRFFFGWGGGVKEQKQ